MLVQQLWVKQLKMLVLKENYATIAGDIVAVEVFAGNDVVAADAAGADKKSNRAMAMMM